MALDDRAWVILDDVEGSGWHRWESFIHAGPDAMLHVTGADRACLVADDTRLALAWFGFDSSSRVHGQSVSRQGWYAPALGSHIPIWTLALQGSGPVPARFGYVLAPDLDPRDVSICGTEQGLSVGLGSVRYELSYGGLGSERMQVSRR